jgi:fucose 4-O-acetylase-like acetyltransferase
VTTRRPEVDWLKSVSILAVVMIHAMRSPFDGGVSSVEVFLGHLTRFAVPGFLAVSGFLYATRSRVERLTTLRRLRRIVVPYLLATAAAQVFWWAMGQPRPVASIPRQILFASSFGPYYYVLQVLFVVMLAPLLSRLGTRGIGVLCVAAVGMQWVFETGQMGIYPFFVHVRNPLLWFGYFCVGWWLRLYDKSAIAWIRGHRTPLIVGTVGAIAALSGSNATLVAEYPGLAYFEGKQSLAWLNVWASLALVYFAAAGRGASGRVTRYLSDLTYTIFLFHMFFVIPATRFIVPEPGEFDPWLLFLRWLPGVVGPIILLEAARPLLRERSRLILGA